MPVLDIRSWAAHALNILKQDLSRQLISGEAQTSLLCRCPDIVAGSDNDARHPPLLSRLAQISKGIAIDSCTELDSIIHTAYDQMASAGRKRTSTEYWRRVYTDACVLRSLADIFDTTNCPLDQARAKD